MDGFTLHLPAAAAWRMARSGDYVAVPIHWLSSPAGVDAGVGYVKLQPLRDLKSNSSRCQHEQHHQLDAQQNSLRPFVLDDGAVVAEGGRRLPQVLPVAHDFPLEADKRTAPLGAARFLFVAGR